MSWFVIEIVMALAPFALLLGWTVRSLRRRRAPPEDAEAAADDGDEA